MRFEYIQGEGTDPYRNLAFEECLIQFVSPGDPILFCWQNDNTIVAGRNQDIYRECRAEEFISEGGRIARRRSGGGAVYHDLGNLNFSIICASEDIAECAYQNIISKALSYFDIPSEYNGRNDLLYGGRKFSGNASYTQDKIIVQHGTLLVGTDTGKMEHFLTPDREKLERNSVGSVKARVICLKEISEKVTIESLRESLKKAVDAKPFERSVDQERLGELTRFYSSDDWIYGGSR